MSKYFDKNKGKKRAVVVLGILVVILAFAMISPPLMQGSSGENTEPVIPDPPEVEEAIALSIAAVGDVMVHKPQLAAQYNGETGTYSFTNNFQYIKEYISAADLALCNVETTFAGGTYSGYPVFNAPDSLATALKEAGFDVALTANNHIMDKGLSGMKRTLEVLREEGLKTAGTQLEGEKNYTILDVKDVKIGIVAYGYETSNVNGRPTINGNYVPDEALPLLNTFNYTTLDQDLEKVRQSIQAARADGAELVICYYHWGEEYQRSPNDYQVYMARQTASFGADIIFASHPHVLQGMEILVDENSGKEVPVFYSMGNFISNQRAETLNNRYTEQGMIAQVNLEYMKSTQEILSLKMSVMPTWVDKYRKGGKDIYSIIPLDENLDQNPTLAESGHLNRAKQALEDIKALLGE
ncbi:MAG: CapA family protein [Anaerovoracaceae bacterium]|jgi:poly-gamma-glutamate capsule biosynthesis protein CapA/YwtB (metallophosphatase superfamily)